MPGRGTLKGGTMTGGKVGMAALAWATLCERTVGSSGMVCTVVTDDGTVVTVTTVTGEAPIVEVTLATWGRSVTITGASIKNKNKEKNK